MVNIILDSTLCLKQAKPSARDDGDDDSAQTVGRGTGSAGRHGSSFRFKSSADSFDLNLTIVVVPRSVIHRKRKCLQLC